MDQNKNTQSKTAEKTEEQRMEMLQAFTQGMNLARAATIKSRWVTFPNGKKMLAS